MTERDSRTVDVEALREKYRPERSSLYNYLGSVRNLECPISGLRYTDSVRYSAPAEPELVRGQEVLATDPDVVAYGTKILTGVWAAASSTHCLLCGERLVWTHIGSVDDQWLDRPVEYRRGLFHIGCAWDLQHDEEQDRRADAYIEAFEPESHFGDAYAEPESY